MAGGGLFDGCGGGVERSQYGAVPVNPKAPTLADAVAAGEGAMAAVADKAEAETPGFADRAAAFALRHLAENGPSTAESMTDAALAAGVKPHDLRAFGPVYARLARSGLIRKTGEQARRRRGHATAGGNVWALVGGGADV